MNEGYITVSDFLDIDISEDLELAKRAKGVRRKKNQKDYFNNVCAFDIETSTVYLNVFNEDDDKPEKELKPHSFMYVWQFQFSDKYTIVGRTWDEYKSLLEHLKHCVRRASARLKLTHPAYLVVFVHNLAYEFQYLQGVFTFSGEDCFFREPRKPIYCRYDYFVEYRCSYLHSNMSLAKFGENMGASVRKLDGSEFDYSKVRYPWTELTDYEIAYCINDVKTLVECIMIECERDGDNLITLPLTSTGYVRRDMKKALQPLNLTIKSILPDLETYNLLRRCFRGGDTHSNRYRTGSIQESGYSVDIESSYPYALLTGLYPMGRWMTIEHDDNTMKRIIRFISMGKAVIADYHFKRLRLKNEREPIPYLPIAKCRVLHAQSDNGRILSADMVVTALTEIDLEIVLDQYTFDTVDAYNTRIALKAPLPMAARDVVIKYYKDKTLLKGVQGKEYEYIKSKNKLNSCYGMTAQQCIHQTIHYIESYKEDPYLVTMPDDEAASKELEKAPFPYSWGVYCTAIARKNLRAGMKLIGCDDYGVSKIIYCDTDSIKYIGPEVDFSNLNKKIFAISKKAGATAPDKKGNLHFMGKWDPEEDKAFKRFLTQGAKRYAYDGVDGTLHVTVSGVTDKPITRKDALKNPALSAFIGTPWKVYEMQKLENFKEGMIWDEAGGTAAVYNDTDRFQYTDPESGNKILITPNVSIVNTTYTMVLESKYSELIDQCMLWLRFCKETGRKYK